MAHRSRLAGFIIDCNSPDLDSAARFWSQALGMPIANPDAGDVPGQYAQLGDTPGNLHVEVQKVDHPSRVHLDIETDDVEAEVARLEALGARKVAFVKRWWLMEAPTGQRFCVVRMREDAGRGEANRWD
ncbi:VOC family protein [Cognatilysobacter lacus]|uniref:VOC family protein n=1 Tax=Cognatilysobacter lacus TaxID=1643323 RepID=A0A5D8YYC0_9GAMM|nr:VOC family protein [Lysobacter lacus]TZF86822.1 VOC family protein [Lysobacter lacus]